MYEFECLTNTEVNSEACVEMEECKPFLGECYPVAE